MFLNLVPALTALLSFSMSGAIPALRFAFDGLFFAGLALIAASLALFRSEPARAPEAAASEAAALDRAAG